MGIIDTGLRPVFTQKSTATALFNPLSGPIDSNLVKEVRGRRWLEAATSQFSLRFAYRMSHDGISWSSTVTAPIATYTTAAGWLYNDDTASSLTTDQRLFLQIGVEAKNATGALLEQGLARMVLEVRPVVGDTLATEYRKVFSDGTTTRVFHPLFEPVALEDVGEMRGTTRLDAPSGTIYAIPAYQLSDDGITWYDAAGGAAGTFSTFGTEVTAAGTEYGTTYTTMSPSASAKRRLVRFGVGAKNASAGVAESALVSLRVDYRRTT